jgi:hypothetical protein
MQTFSSREFECAGKHAHSQTTICSPLPWEHDDNVLSPSLTANELKLSTLLLPSPASFVSPSILPEPLWVRHREQPTSKRENNLPPHSRTKECSSGRGHLYLHLCICAKPTNLCWPHECAADCSSKDARSFRQWKNSALC